MEKWLRRLWLVIGLLVLPFLVWGLYSVASEWVAPGYSAPTVALASDTLSTDGPPRAVRAVLAEPVFGSDQRLIRIHYGAADLSETFLSQGHSGRAYGSRPEGALVNIAFLSPQGQVSLLFDRPASIRTIDSPDASQDSARKWIAYEVALTDTDRDGQLDGDDETSLFVTDLAGGGLRRASPEALEYTSYDWVDPAGVLLIAGLERARSSRETDPAKRPQRFVYFDARDGTVTVATALDSAIAAAGALLRR